MSILNYSSYNIVKWNNDDFKGYHYYGVIKKATEHYNYIITKISFIGTPGEKLKKELEEVKIFNGCHYLLYENKITSGGGIDDEELIFGNIINNINYLIESEFGSGFDIIFKILETNIDELKSDINEIN